MAGNNNRSFIQLPSNVSDSIQLRRFLDKLVQELDVAFSNRGEGGFASSTVITSLNDLIKAFLELEAQLKAGDLILTTLTNITLENVHQNVLVNCLTGNVTITLPLASSAYINGRTKRIAITKIDASTNLVNIVTSDGALIVSEPNQQLLYQGEVLNFITDGTNWHLGA